MKPIYKNVYATPKDIRDYKKHITEGMDKAIIKALGHGGPVAKVPKPPRAAGLT